MLPRGLLLKTGLSRCANQRVRRGDRSMQYGQWTFKATVVPTIVTALLLGGLVALGLWQLDRSDQKRALIATFEARLHAPPLAVTHTEQVPAELYRTPLRYLFQRARFTGAWLPSQYLLDNRIHRGVAGFQVISALRLAPGDTAVLVNRGWLALGKTRADLPDVALESGQLAVTGYLAEPGEDAFVLGDTGYHAEHWPRVVQRLELANLETGLGVSLLPLVLMLDPESPQGFVRDWKPVYSLPPERHLGYAVQWFALALALAVIYLVVNTKRRRPDATSGR